MHKSKLVFLIVLLTGFVSCFIDEKDPSCKDGIVGGKICCHKSCGRCGGAGCSRKPGGAKNCCRGVIKRSRRKCTRYVAPCIVEPPKFNPPMYEPPMYMEYPVQEDYVPIIGYHRIGGPWLKATMSVEQFKGQVEYLTDVAGCNWITMERLSEYIKKKEKVPTKACVMTFDDAITFQYHNTLCTLNKYKVPATYYLITSLIGSKPYYLTWEEVEKLHRIGHDMEAHTKTHAHLSRLNITEQGEEILGCKACLESRGYSVKTFAYPYGEYNEDTFSILRHSDYVLTRDTRVDFTWTDPRAITISQKEDYLFHFFYIRPEFEDGIDLWERIKYTGWWQFEDNYVLVKGSKRSARILKGRPKYMPTNTSYAFIKMSSLHDEVSTQFLTKNEGGFTLYLMVCNTTSSAFAVKVDDVMYNVHASGDVYQTRWRPFYGFHVNIETLLPGAHTLNIINIAGKALYLDKFRLFSNVSQDFREPLYYQTCDPEVDDYCQCDETVQ